MFCKLLKEFLSENRVVFEDRDITKDPAAITELQTLGYMTSPVTVIDGTVVVGFDEPKLTQALKLEE